MSGGIRVMVVEEREILRRGLIDALSDDSALTVINGSHSVTDCAAVDIAVVSASAARCGCFQCPIIIYDDDRPGPIDEARGNRVLGLLSRESVTPAQLRVTVHAAAAGLRVNARVERMDSPGCALEPRQRRVLELLADGHSTREIAELMCYSERTIKKLIGTLLELFEARSRAQVVAEAIRQRAI